MAKSADMVGNQWNSDKRKTSTSDGIGWKISAKKEWRVIAFFGLHYAGEIYRLSFPLRSRQKRKWRCLLACRHLGGMGLCFTKERRHGVRSLQETQSDL